MLPPGIAKTLNDYKTDVFLVPYIIVSQASTVCGIDIYLIVSNIAQEKLFVSLFGFCEPFWILFGKWQLSNGNLYLRVQISLLLPQTHRFRDISLANFIMQSLSMEFPQGLGKRVTIWDFIVPYWKLPEVVFYIGV